MLLKNFENKENILLFKKKLWVSNSDQLKLDIIQETHDQSIVNHSENRRIYNFVKRTYYWFEMRNFTERYVGNCHICKRSKASRDRYSDFLNSLSISNKSWTDIIMNFVTELLLNRDFNVILMIVDRLTKMRHYISCTTKNEDTTVEETVRLLINHVWKLHKLPDTIISDRESQFVSLLWKSVCEALKINTKLPTAFHSETDARSEIANQKIKRYLRNYCNYQQNDWTDWISIAEFAFNACISSFIELSSFFANYDFESKISFDFISIEDTARERILTRKAFDISEKMKNIWEYIKTKLANAQASYKHHADRTRKDSSKYRLEDLVWLFIKNIKTNRSSKKLNNKMIDLYKITKILKDACQLDLSASMKIHNSFHVSLLRLAFIDSLTDEIQSSSSPIIVDKKEKYEIDDVLNNKYHYNKLQYRVSWIEHSSNDIWYSAENFQDNSKEILKDYHDKYSDKLESELRLVHVINFIIWINEISTLAEEELIM